ncbi:MAG: chemotaxis protein CheV [Phycisphaerae bacterium]
MSKRLSNILTDAGTNELEVLVFHLDGGFYGVNVAKVREIIAVVPLTQMPHTHPAVRGVFNQRDHVHPLVDLRKFFKMPPAADEENARIIVTEFNNQRMGFLVDDIDRIHRVSWSDMGEVPAVGRDDDTAMTGVLQLDDHLILMLDFERVAFQISGITGLEQAPGQTAGTDRSQIKVLLADDSAMMRRMLGNAVQSAGFTDVVIATDGREAWNMLNDMLESATLPDVIVTDIEMPRMDGLFLTKSIKEHQGLKHVPVIVFSSLVSDDNLKKCEAVGADRQLTKPELPGLVSVIDELMAQRVPG